MATGHTLDSSVNGYPSQQKDTANNITNFDEMFQKLENTQGKINDAINKADSDNPISYLRVQRKVNLFDTSMHLVSKISETCTSMNKDIIQNIR